MQPRGALRYMLTHDVGTRTINWYRYGDAEVMYGIPTFIDGRADLFLGAPGHVLRWYVDLATMRVPADRVLRHFGARYLFIPKHSDLAVEMHDNRRFREVYAGRISELWRLIPRDAPG